LQDIRYDAILGEAIRGDRHFLYLVAASSFVEIAADLYTANLLRYFDGDAEVSAWLEQVWQHEETQHGEALKRYVTEVWPEFPWQPAFDAFFAAYAPVCNDDHLGPTRALELVARCVVETGTSSYYGMLEHASPEPVLAHLAGLIRRDEVHHYKHFFRYFRDYQARRPVGRTAVLHRLLGRLREVGTEDELIAFRSAFQAANPGIRDWKPAYQAFRRRNAAIAHAHFPYRTAAKMLLKPLRLSPRLERLTTPLLAGGARLARRV
jgi:hypothetical protein